MTNESIPLPTHPAFKNLTSQKFERLTVESFAGRGKDGRLIWHCTCECGKEISVRGKDLKTGNTRSCGCYQADRFKERHTTHGGTHTPLYVVWCAMKARCHRVTDKAYPRYGGRRIMVCQEWRDNFETFKSDMGKKPFSDSSIDRIDNDKGYSPDNCRWASPTVQRRNQRLSVKNTSGVNGVSPHGSKWAAQIVVNTKKLWLGTFDTIGEAAAARKEAELKYWI